MGYCTSFPRITVLTLRKATYLYFFDNEWYGIPFTIDLDTIAPDVNLFKELNLPLPPPYGNLPRSEWTWKKLVEYTKILKKNTTVDFPFFFPTGGLREDYMLANIARSYGAGLANGDMSCGLTSQRFIDAYKEVIAPLYIGNDAATPPPFAPETLAKWKGKPVPQNPLDFDWDLANYIDWYEPSTLGYRYGFRMKEIGGCDGSPGGECVYYPAQLMGFHKGSTTFLGGTGFILNRYGDHLDEGWEFLERLTNAKEYDYMVLANLAARAGPTYDDLLTDPRLANDPMQKFIATQLRNAVPPRYPLTALKIEGKIEDRDPFRMLFRETVLQNVPIEDAVKRACAVYDDLLLPDCDDTFIAYDVQPCERIRAKRLVIPRVSAGCKPNSTFTLPGYGATILTVNFDQPTLKLHARISPPQTRVDCSHRLCDDFGFSNDHNACGHLPLEGYSRHQVNRLPYQRFARTGDQIGQGLVIAYNGLLILGAVFCAFSTRKVAEQFNEAKVAGLAVYIVVLFIVIGLLIGSVIENPAPRAIFQSVCTLVAVVSATCMYVVPKILKLHESLGTPPQGMKCITCNGTGKMSGWNATAPDVKGDGTAGASNIEKSNRVAGNA
ncbi:hypothetical protein HK104_005487 [Borealophlyctis nickersoniae]|nr:hypothetical protein HK104_005487 [Borealophlyctis nickersoniae]